MKRILLFIITTQLKLTIAEINDLKSYSIIENCNCQKEAQLVTRCICQPVLKEKNCPPVRVKYIKTINL